jgi:flagellar hook protein FlgE
MMQFSRAEAKVVDGQNVTVWNWKNGLADAAGRADAGTLTFDSYGDLYAATPADGMTLAYDFTYLRQVAAGTDVEVREQDGVADGSLTGFTIDKDGKIFGHYTNRMTEPLAQLAMANVINPLGLAAHGGTMFSVTPASGEAIIGPPNQFIDLPDGTRGYIALDVLSGFLEGSNVESERELTNLIMTQRGYQANARSATTADEMLREIAQLKR